MLPVAQAMGRIAYLSPLLRGDVYAPSEGHVCYNVPPLLCGDVYAPSDGHVYYTLRRGCSYAEAVYKTPGDITSYLLLIVQRFSKRMHSVCILIYGSI